MSCTSVMLKIPANLSHVDFFNTMSRVDVMKESNCNSIIVF